jgi:hypothetical protein
MFTQVTEAQNTGTWEGKWRVTGHLQLNIGLVALSLCGYSWDYELNNKKKRS